MSFNPPRNHGPETNQEVDQVRRWWQAGAQPGDRNKPDLTVKDAFHDLAPMTRPAAARLQVLLGQLGYLDLNRTDGPTGYFGNRETDAIKRFQQDNELKPDGVILANGPTARKLNEAGEKTLGVRATPVAWSANPNDWSNPSKWALEQAGRSVYEKLKPVHTPSIWKDRPDLRLDPNGSEIEVDGSFQIIGGSTTQWFDGKRILVDWQPLDSRGRIMPEWRQKGKKPTEHVFTKFIGNTSTKPFSPPYKHNGKWKVTIQIPPQQDINGNSAGFDFDVVTPLDAGPATKFKDTPQ